MKGRYAALAGRIQQSLVDVERLVSRAERLMNRAQQSGDDGYLDGVALNLHGFYAGLERIFEDIARTVDRAVPSGPDWHQDVLLQMSAEVAATRPPVLSQEARHCLDDYRGFRHVVRNVYTFNLRPRRLQELTEPLRDCFQIVEQDLNGFVAFLQQLAEIDDEI